MNVSDLRPPCAGGGSVMGVSDLRPPGWFLGCTAFLCGAAIMVIEILGARVIGPFFGVGLFVWTSLIAVAMIALAAGYWLGGRLADRTASAGPLFAGIAASGALTLLVPVAQAAVLEVCVPLGLRAGAFTAALVLFGPPLFLLGCVSPWLVRLGASDLGSVGRVAGGVYGLSTVGSIAGTVLTGFVLIAVLRVGQIFTLVGGVLLGLAGVYLVVFRKRWLGLAVVPLALLGVALQQPGAGVVRTLPGGTRAQLVDVRDSHYGSVRVIDYAYGAARTRELTIDGLIQGGVDLRSGLPVYEYLYLLEYLPVAVRPGGKRCLVLGAGAGIVPMWYQSRGIRTDVVDIDPDVVALARRYFGFAPKGSVYLGDARYYLATATGQYDYVVLDVFNGDATPAHLLSVEALRLAKQVLTPGGVLAINLHAAVDGDNRTAASVGKTLAAVFDQVDLYPAFDPAAAAHGNVVVLAYDGARTLAGPSALQGAPVHPMARDGVLNAWERVRAAPGRADAVLLTDEYNPIDLFDLEIREDIRRGILESTPWAILLG